jgi:hypothetical protein
LAGECIEYLIETLDRDSSAQAVDSVRRELKEQLESSEEEPVFIANKKGSFDQLLDYSVQSALYIIQARRVDDLQWFLDAIEDVDITVRMSRTDTEINILRQGFLTLTTIFDATMFDLVRAALHRDFFSQIALFASKQDKVSVEKLNKYSNFDEFRESVIEEQLKGMYLREVLFILSKNGVRLTDPSKGDEFIHLLEVVMRRNIHIHNRGIVDGKYMETDENGTPRFNVYNLTLGTVANIDSQYWERANRLILNCVKLTADWVNSLS